MKKGETLINIDNFAGGTMTQVDEARLATKFAAQSLNFLQVQDGRWETRWGFNYFGIAIPGESSIDGAHPYDKDNGDGTTTRELVAIGGTTGKIYTSTDGGSWTQIGTLTLTPGKTAHFLQTGGELWIANATDDLVRYDGTDLNVYTQLAEPTNVVLNRGGGLSSGSFTAYYQVTAKNDVGDTAGSVEATITFNKNRDVWSSTSNENISISWDAVTGANRYDVYYSDESGYEFWLDSVTTNSYTDDGSKQPNAYQAVPIDNTTTAPKFASMESDGDRTWSTGDPHNPNRVYATGSGTYSGTYSSFYGGFFVDVDKGGRDRPTKCTHYRTGKGDPIMTVLCSNPEGTGSTYQIEVTTTTVGSTNFVIPVTYKVVGSIGADSALGVAKARDNIVFTNKRGVFALRNKAQMYNVLSTDELSQAWRPNYRSLNGNKINESCSYFYDGKVFFSFAEGSTNDIIVIWDLERNNWNYKWTIGVKRFLEYTDSAGKTHFLAIPTTGGQLWEISENFMGDFGQPFYQSYTSPLIPVSKDKTDVLKPKHTILELGRPKGSISFSVSGLTAKKGFVSQASTTITDTVSNSGVGWDLFSDFRFSDTAGIPSTFSQASVKVPLKHKKKLYAIQYNVSSNTAATKFTILSIQTKGKLISKSANALRG